jgi:hypothetical protein
MTTLDDDRLSVLLGLVAESFEVPAAGPDEVLARARTGAAVGDGAETRGGGGDGAGAADDDAAILRVPRRGRRLAVAAGRHRMLSVAACVVVALLVAGTISAVVGSPSNQTVTSGLRTPKAGSGGAVVPPATTTTSPAVRAQSGTGALGQNAAPLGAAHAGGAAGNAASGAPGTSSLPKDSVGQSARIEQTGTLGLVVGRGDLAGTMTRLAGLAGTYGGFVANSANQNGPAGGTPFGTITLEVPVDNFSPVLKQAEHYGKTSNVSTKATDVTGQYVDLQARLSALEETRQQYLSILAKATSIGDILAVQEQLDGTQSQIEQVQGQLQVLTSETSYSTLNVTVGENGPPPRPGPLPESGLVHSWHDSVGGFVAGVDGVVRLAGPFLFALLCLAIVAVGGRLLWRRYQRHRL